MFGVSSHSSITSRPSLSYKKTRRNGGKQQQSVAGECHIITGQSRDGTAHHLPQPHFVYDIRMLHHELLRGALCSEVEKRNAHRMTQFFPSPRAHYPQAALHEDRACVQVVLAAWVCAQLPGSTRVACGSSC